MKREPERLKEDRNGTIINYNNSTIISFYNGTIINYYIMSQLIFERFIQLGKHVKIAINISITGAFG